MPNDVHATLTRLAASPRPRILVVTHGWGGGVRRHVDELVRALAARAEPVVLTPSAGGTVHLAWSRDAERADLWFAPQDGAALLGVLRAIGVTRVHLHHVDGLPQDVLGIAATLGVPLDVTLHDAYPYCPRYHLERGDGRYCGVPGKGECNDCLARGPAQWPLDVAGWREAFRSAFAGPTRAIAPTRDAAARFARHFPDVAVEVWPHPDSSGAAPPRALRVAICGRLTRVKGFDVVVACARDAERRALAARVSRARLDRGPVAAASRGPDLDDGRVRRGRAAAPHRVRSRPTCSCSRRRCPRRGRTRSRRRSRPGARSSPRRSARSANGSRACPTRRSSPWDAPAEAWNDAILAAVPQRAATPGVAVDGVDWPTYVERLAAAWPASATPSRAPLPTLEARHLTAPHDGQRALTLEELVRAGALRGEAQARAELVSRAAQADAVLADVARDGAPRERELAEARGRIAALESSRSWKLTAPLRDATMRIRIARTRAAAFPAALRQLPRQSATAFTVLKEQGPAALLRRVRDKAARARLRRAAGAQDLDRGDRDRAARVRRGGHAPRQRSSFPRTGRRSRRSPASRACTRRSRTTTSR